jgi:hypothetical protein
MTSPSHLDSADPADVHVSGEQGYPQPPSQLAPGALEAATSDGHAHMQIQDAGRPIAGASDLAYALASASEQMLDAPDASSLWPLMAREAARLIAAEAVAVVRHFAPTVGLVVASAGGTPADDSSWLTAVETAARHGWLSEPRLIDDVSLDRAWSSAVGWVGWRSLLVVPLDGRHRKDPTRLAWFSAEVAAFGRYVEVAQLFGRHAGAAVRTVVTRETLTEAIAARHRIGQAQGILIARCGLTTEQAFEALKRRSQGTNVKLRIIADQVIKSGELDEHGTTQPQQVRQH